VGAVPVTAQKTFCSVPATGARSSQNGATSSPSGAFPITVLIGSVKGAKKLMVPLLLTKSRLKLAPPKRIARGRVMSAEESSPRLRFVPLMLR
jgi:hypothetical protein